jgi:hypothetical protein
MMFLSTTASFVMGFLGSLNPEASSQYHENKNLTTTHNSSSQRWIDASLNSGSKDSQALQRVITNNPQQQGTVASDANEFKPFTKTAAQAQSLRLITGHTAATLPKGSFELGIQHRFGEINSGAYNLYGLDNFNSMRISADYGITDKITAGIGRSSYRKTYNGYLKWRFLGEPESKFNLTFLTDIAVDARARSDWNLEPFNHSHRLFFTQQLIASWQVNKGLLLSISPTLVHANLVSQRSYSNDMPVISGYIRQQIIPKFALTAEASVLINSITPVKPKSNPTLGFGFEYFTPQHAFQINLTNSRALNEPFFLTDNPNSLQLGNFCLGFNLIRRW